ncbi:molybdopterin molybdotransferase MoeA [Paraconexibacter antarcticus]|uniref:Molybdopterin molybdenumtransferase n=1 Tax=Paraconexibacter antarcticus TaxID=2949664 RepID=A0ABY5DYN5_9ACTN|nr:gephyrin-like molybdotransferase Glp [Paraconexibacter antarcticus]UTI66448.1 molybdopterin molybdotransferase MoeA [Paraconexibacter antarcticus]
MTATALLDVETARARVLAAVALLPAQTVPLSAALGRVLVADVRAGGDVPPFTNSAMDGFAIQAAPAGRRLRVAGESRAGTPSPVAVTGDTAVRISTGAMLPEGADAVIMVERTDEHEDGTVTLEADVAPGQNVRGAGEDMRAGTVVLRAGTTIDAAAVGIAAGAHAGALACARRPRVAVLSTGDELVPPGSALGPGQIHNSNALTLVALATEAGGEALLPVHVPDSAAATRAAIAAALEHADVLVLSGGVSVGPHDHVKGALEACGVDEDFWRVALRPGKPTWFGTRGEQLVFGLPGNPVSAMVTFLLFVRPALRALQGADPAARRVQAPLAEAVPRNEGRDELVRIHFDDAGHAALTGPQGSHVLTSMRGADGLARIPAGPGELAAGTPVEIELLR